MRSEQIEFFMSCAACLNFSLAAKYHFVSVSTLSRSISSLEDELRVKLFERGYHGHKLTDAGKALFETSMRSVLEYEYFLRKWSEKPINGVIIGCRPYDGAYEALINFASNSLSENLIPNHRLILIPDDNIIGCLNDGIINYALVETSFESGHLKEFAFNCGDRDFKFISKISCENFV